MAADVRSLFHAAVERVPADRAAYLDEACAGDAGLRQRVEALLRAHDEPGEFLSEANRVLDATATHSPSSPLVGTTLADRYKLLEPIGEGGMGTVWMAEQREPVKRLVALKLIKAGMDSRAVVARFEAERQALALMDHPNIAKVLDGGTTAEGRPYFVMELIKGLPLTDYCDARRLTVRDRLDLFATVCSAVQNAHQKGVIHRDLKPTNVLITEHDGKPVPKVIDFGLAKALTAPGMLTDKTLHTSFGAVVGTPLYMAPEQVGINSLDVDTRTDIYALGVILYELLTGTTPLEKKRLREAAWDEMRRLIREEEPPRPSVRLSSSDALPSLAAGRQIEPSRLMKLVRGELDWIVMKSLEKDRNRRYETANELARDVERHLAGEAVHAVPPSAAYRLRKSYRRNRELVQALVAIFAGLVVTSYAFYSAEVQWAEAAERSSVANAVAKLDAEAKWKEAEAAKVEAQVKETEANAVMKFFEDKIFSAGRPKGEAGGLGHDVALRDAITSTLPALGTTFRDQPLVEARVRRTLGTTFFFLGDYVRAGEQCKLALALYIRHGGPDHPDTLASQNDLAHSYEALNRHAEALLLVDEVLAKADRPGVDPRLIPSAIKLRVQCCQKLGDLAGCRAAVDMMEKRNLTDAGSLYDAACDRAVTASLQVKLEGPDTAKLARADADKAMAWLTKAVAAGYTNAEQIKTDADLDFLRDRADFKKLLADLDAKAPMMKGPDFSPEKP
jgi:serine/threonine protein kinase